MPFCQTYLEKTDIIITDLSKGLMCNLRHSSAGHIITDGLGRPGGLGPHPSDKLGSVTAPARLWRTGRQAAMLLACEERKLFLSELPACYQRFECHLKECLF